MKKLLLLTYIATVLISCDSILEKYPKTSISSETFWKSPEDFKMASNALYNSVGLNHFVSIDTQADDYYGHGVNSISAGLLVPSNSDEVWNEAYPNIRKANDIIEHAHSSNLNPVTVRRFEGEARFFRAYQYFELLKRFGDVPLILKTLDITSEELYAPRTERAIVVDTVIADLKFAAEVLPTKTTMPKDEEGRITRGAALGLLSRVALYEGTHRKYHNVGSHKELLELAKESATKVIESGEYTLFPNLVELFYETNENNNEVMLSQFFAETFTPQTPRGRGLVLDATMAPTKTLANDFLCKDGLPISLSTLFKGYETLNSEFENRDPRMACTIWEPGTDFLDGPMVPELFRAKTGYWPKKPGDLTCLNKTFVYTDIILMRYAEILLNFAEATYELNGKISDAELDISINQLRNRVAMPKLSNAFIETQGGKLNMLDEIRRERHVELAGEGFRYDDIIRWKIAEEVLPKAILGTKFQQQSYPEMKVGKDVIIDENGFIVAESAKNRSFTAPKNYLFPIPLREISLNSNLTQNPGW